MDYNIKQFNFKDIPEYATITILASRRSGKSVMTRYILIHEFIKRRKIKNYVIVSPTLHNNDYSFMDDKFKFTSFDQDFLDKILRRQQQLIEEDPDGKHELVLILDDIVKSTDQKTKDLLSRLYTLSRHYRLYIVLVSQSLRHELTPIIKFNSDIVIVFASRNYENKREISDLWLGFGKKEDRENGFAIMDTVALGYRAMIINNTVHSNDPADIIHYYEVDYDKLIPRNFQYS